MNRTAGADSFLSILLALSIFGAQGLRMKDEALTEMIIGAAFRIHRALGPGFLEKVCENAMRIELVKLGIKVKQQEPINVLYDGQIVGEYFADLLVEDRMIVELKALQVLSTEHEVQLVNYLTATAIDIGLLINFGSSVQVKRKYREYRPRASSQSIPATTQEGTRT